MSFSMWEYIRRRTCEAVLAGVHDALEQLERQDQAAALNQAARQLRKKLQDANAAQHGNGGQVQQDTNRAPRPENIPPSAAPPVDSANRQALPPNGAAHQPPARGPVAPSNRPEQRQVSNSVPGSQQGGNHSGHRKVGRPRKETHG